MGLTVTISNSSGKTVTSGSLGTGYKVTLVGATTNTYNIVVYGDASGDGKVNSLDLLKIQKYLLGEGKLSGVEKNAADASKDGKVNSLDLLKIQKYALGEGTINQ